VTTLDPNYTVDETLAAFREASDWFLTVLGRIGDEQWSSPGLGQWTILELAAHASRAYTTVAEYLTPDGEIDVYSPAEYFLRAMPDSAVNESIAARGRREAVELADDPIEVVRQRAARTFALVESAPVGAVCVSRGGTIALGDYLATRVVELSVHTLDLADAAGLDGVEPPPGAAGITVSVLGALASQQSAGMLMRALTGRVPLPRGFSVFP
jgi:uncharacterized protein (TIGR03083 family)